MGDHRLIGVGLDYESESPWVWTDDDPERIQKDCEDQGNWFAVTVPTPMVEEFVTARDRLNAAVEAIHAHVGFDAEFGRLAAACGDYKGDSITIREHVVWDHCDNCGWPKDAHGPQPVGRPT